MNKMFEKCKKVSFEEKARTVNEWLTEERLTELLLMLGFELKNKEKLMFILTEETRDVNGFVYTMNKGCSEDEKRLERVKEDLEQQEERRQDSIDDCLYKKSDGLCLHCDSENHEKRNYKTYYIKETRTF